MKQRFYRGLLDGLDNFFMGLSNTLRRLRGLEAHQWSR